MDKKMDVFFRTGAAFAAVFFLFVCASCLSVKTQEKRLAPPGRSTGEFRLDDIRRCAADDPVKAIDLIGIYRTVYGQENSRREGSDMETALDALEAEAVASLKEKQAAAIREERWDDAASLARSLASMGLEVENTGMEPDFILAEAKKSLVEGGDLAAFLLAVRSHEMKPLGFEDALLFLKRAVEVKQRRTAAFFLNIAGENDVPGELKEYASGRDGPQEMIKGVATVLVDRGIRIERGRGMPDRALGSAFFVDASGLLITNYHVISSEVDPAYEGYSRLHIRMGDSASARIPAKVIGWDKAMDLALLKTEIKPEYVFSVVDRVTPRVGDTILAIGSPGGLEKTVTSGIVSTLGRRFLQIGDVIQIDAAVNPGNSGGPVVDTSGRLVGIVFAGIEQYQGLNFAVPAERLAAALPVMIKGGKAERPWLGLTLSESSRGAEIIYTAPFTPASEHQVGEGTLIKTINGEKASAPQGALIPALQDMLFSSRPGELVALETSDGKHRVMMTVPRPDVPLAEAAKKDSKERIAAPLFGLILSPSLVKSFSSSYLVKKVIRGSIADEAGLSEQDPVSIRGFRMLEKDGYALMEINVKKRSMGYMETTMQLPALLDSPDTL
ncbi:MAG: trypsin-like peptidase domain-containing protein [Treponema sp.]|jgi:S1-C subfamily serine protease|nr:trypsin-like peptidase domain-containing protein [Treponema sp.]